MRIAIVGWGLEGQSAYSYFGPQHSYLICNEEPRDDFPASSDTVKIQYITSERTPGLTGNVSDLSYLDGIEACDKIIYTVTNAKNLEKKFGKDSSFWSKATTIQHIFFEQVKTKNIIGVTGTKGKGTTSTLIAKMLEAAGKATFLGGNVGTPVLNFIRDVKADDWVVLELSNFQLYKLTYSPHIAVCLMVVEEHMDWHPDMQDYLGAKSNLFRHQEAGDVAIYYSQNENSKQIASNSPGQMIPYFAKPGARIRDDGMIVIGNNDIEVIKKSDVKLLGEHNLQNICAAITAVWQVTQNIEAMNKILTSFSGLEHRLEFVVEQNGVRYYDDSFGTTPDTAIVAMQAITQPKVMILGGHDKGVPFDDLADTVLKQNVKHVITIGKVGPKIAELLRAKGFKSITENLADMKSIVTTAQKTARPGDVVLLSCATSSFGMFKDYKDRGNQFKKAALELS